GELHLESDSAILAGFGVGGNGSAGGGGAATDRKRLPEKKGAPARPSWRHRFARRGGEGNSPMSGLRWRLAVLLWLIFSSAPVLAQNQTWGGLMRDGEAAHWQGNYAEAEKDFKAAVGIAEQSEFDDRVLLAESLKALASL